MVVKLGRWRIRQLAIPVGFGIVGLALVVAGILKPLPSYLVAAQDLMPGQPLASEQFIEVEMDLGAVSDGYVVSFEPGLMLSDFVAAGELVPTRLVQPVRTANQTLLRIVPAAQPAAIVQAGTMVGIWQVTEIEDISVPTMLVPAAMVVQVIEPDGLFASDVSHFEVQLSQDQATAVITAIAADLPLFMVPIS